MEKLGTAVVIGFSNFTRKWNPEEFSRLNAAGATRKSLHTSLAYDMTCICNVQIERIVANAVERTPQDSISW